MRVTFLGTGTSYGIPVPACTCPVCTSPDPRDKRLRTAVLVEAAGLSVLLDTPPDLRTQCLRHAIPRIDLVLLSHSHADHLFGLDDLRPYTNRMPAPLPVFASPGTARDAARIFDYLSAPPLPGTSLARISLRPVPPDPFDFGPLRLTPLPVPHGRADMYGWRIDAGGRSAAFVTDCKTIPPSTLDRLRGLDLMVLDALRPEPHPTHLSLSESAAFLGKIAAKRSFVVHLCHAVSHAAADSLLPPSVHPARDGLVLDF